MSRRQPKHLAQVQVDLALGQFGTCKQSSYCLYDWTFRILFNFQNNFSGSYAVDANLLKLESTNPKKNSQTLDAF